jgi:hypothetical protein
MVKSKGKERYKVHQRKGHEGAEGGGQKFCTTLFSISALGGGGGGGGGVSATPRPPYPRKRLGNNCTGGWMGLRGVRTGARKSHPQRNSIPQPSSQ